MALLTLPSFLPPWARILVRRLLFLVNVALVAYILAESAGEGLGLEVAQTWTAITAMLSQASLLFSLVKRPDSTAEYLSVQCLGVHAVCHWARLFGLSSWVVETADGIPVPFLLAGLSAATFGLTVWHRRRGLEGAEGEPGLERGAVLAGEAFGAELVRSLQGPRAASLQKGSWLFLLWRCLEQSVLPVAALLLSVVVEAILDPRSLLKGWRPVAAAWHQTLEAMALLPQLRVLLALRAVLPSQKAGEEAEAVAVVPPELQYWLTSMALGHFFASLTALGAWWALAAGAESRKAFTFACGEGFNAAILGELLLAHFRAKWHGDKRLALPI